MTFTCLWALLALAACALGTLVALLQRAWRREDRAADLRVAPRR